MNKIWIVFKYEYWRHVKKKRFILAVLSLPFFIALMIGVGLLSAFFAVNDQPVGYVDQAGLFSQASMPPEKSPIPFRKPIKIISYANESDARTALEGDLLQAVFVISPDYIESGSVQMISQKAPDSSAISTFRDFLQFNLLKNTSPDIKNRVLKGANFEVQATQGDQKSTEGNILGIILPFVAGFMFMLAINISGGYLLQAVVEEKENRTMEIIITSISPSQLMTGKVLGNLSVGLTQLVIWLIFGAVGVGFVMRLFPELQSSQLDTGFLLLMVLTFLPAFVMVAAMMAALGATATEAREAQQIAGIFTIPIAIPFWFVSLLITNPNSPFSIFLSVFPFTAPVSLPLRAAFTTIPTWQVVLTISLLIMFAIAALWLAGRAFRMGMLRYGKRLSLKELFQKAGA